jgi:uncharacterized protein
MISKKEEGADLDIVLAAALLHDLVVYPKGSRRTNHSADESADIAKKILSEYKYYPVEKIEKVVYAIRTHSYYNPEDPFCESDRELDDTRWTLDHIKKKLLILKNSMHTKTAKEIAKQRTDFIDSFLNQLRKEILYRE